MAATHSARKSTAVDDPAPRSNAPFGYTARNIRTFSNIALGSDLACFPGVSLEQAADLDPPTFATDIDVLEALEIAYLRITKSDEKRRGTKYSIPPGKAF
ncbi:hypothetical protein FGLOB1_11322 [Fusarium globosum]|uniref:Uncharacterized protein n=1 Tax=Fusarium globosum TaxID=78864 RepID=A0A8H6D0Y9_9HYPO|nr:hypothetical protein FGLOB1_11322 [Fusarium globosum]